jgi:hypothetical protein
VVFVREERSRLEQLIEKAVVDRKQELEAGLKKLQATSVKRKLSTPLKGRRGASGSNFTVTPTRAFETPSPSLPSNLLAFGSDVADNSSPLDALGRSMLLPGSVNDVVEPIAVPASSVPSPKNVTSPAQRSPSAESYPAAADRELAIDSSRPSTSGNDFKSRSPSEMMSSEAADVALTATSSDVYVRETHTATLSVPSIHSAIPVLSLSDLVRVVAPVPYKADTTTTANPLDDATTVEIVAAPSAGTASASRTKLTKVQRILEKRAERLAKMPDDARAAKLARLAARRAWRDQASADELAAHRKEKRAQRKALKAARQAARLERGASTLSLLHSSGASSECGSEDDSTHV